MFFKKCDMISPSITLYFKGDSIHSSVFSGILTIISYIIILVYGVIYIIGFAKKSNPSIFFYTRYIEDAGYFPLNSSSLFHFIRLGNIINNQIKEIKYDSINIYGLESSIDNYILENNISNFNHWVYGACNKNDAKNLEHIESLINLNFPDKSACIRQYYDYESKKYFNTDEENFKWPALKHGCANDNATNYGIIMEKKLEGNCTDDYLDTSYFVLYFMDQYVDALNYRTPYIKYLYKLTNDFFSDSFTVNHLNFNPSHVTSNTGIFFDNQNTDISYQYFQNEKINMLKNNTNIIASCYFWMQNTMQYYERNYQLFQDLLSEIGGFSNIIILIAKAINYFWINYIILLDTEELVLNSDRQNYEKVKIESKPTILRKASEILNPPKLSNKNYNKKTNDIKQSSISKVLLKDKVDICKMCNNNNELKSNISKNSNKKSNNLNNNENYEDKKLDLESYSDNISNLRARNIDINSSSNKDNSIKNLIESKSNSFKKSLNEIDTDVKGLKYKNLTKQNFTWIKYMIYIIFCKSNNPKINFYETFRTQIISEENMIQNHLNIYKLLKKNNIKNLNPFNFKNQDHKNIL